MIIKWEPSLSTGIGEIDNQHREFMSNLNSFGDSLEKGLRGGELQALFDFAVKYAGDHFLTEEIYMLSYAYPGYKTHKKYHEDFKESFETLRNKMGNEGWEKRDVAELYEKFSGWFVSHIKTQDAALGNFLKNRIKGG